MGANGSKAGTAPGPGGGATAVAGAAAVPTPARPPPRPEDLAAATACQVTSGSGEGGGGGGGVVAFSIWPTARHDSSHAQPDRHGYTPLFDETGGEQHVFPNTIELTNRSTDRATVFIVETTRPFDVCPCQGLLAPGATVTVSLRPLEAFRGQILAAVAQGENGGVSIEGDAGGMVTVSVWDGGRSDDTAVTTTTTTDAGGRSVRDAAAAIEAAGVGGAVAQSLQCKFVQPRIPFATSHGRTTDPLVQVGIGGVWGAATMPSNGGRGKWAGAVCAAQPDASFYCIPSGASRVLKVTPGPRLIDLRDAKRSLKEHLTVLREAKFFHGAGPRGQPLFQARIDEALSLIRHGAWLRAVVERHYTTRIGNSVESVATGADDAADGVAEETDAAAHELRSGQVLAQFEPDMFVRESQRTALSYGLDDPRRGAVAENGTDSVVTALLGHDLGDGANKWHGGALAPDGRIFCAPHTARRVLCIDPVAQTAVEVGPPCPDGDGWIGAVEWEGKVWCIPHTATRFLRVDPEAVDDAVGVEYVGPETTSTGVVGRWCGGVRVADAVYLIPDTATQVLKLDLKSLTFAAIGDTFEAMPNQWGGPAVARDGCIYCPPRAGARVLKIDPKTDSATTVGESLDHLAPEGCTDKWRDAVAGYWGGIVFVPFDATDIVVFDPKTTTTTAAPNASVGGARQFCSGVENAATGGVYCVPFDATQLVGVHSAVTADTKKRTVLLTFPDPATLVEPFEVRDRATDVLTPPPYWSIKSLQAAVTVVDVTAEMRIRVQALMDSTCNPSTLGTGRDQKTKGTVYTKLRAVKISRIESPDVWRLYAAQRETMLGQLRRHKVEKVDVRSKAEWMQPECDPQVNEVYLWHGTKPALLDTIQTNGFDERVGGLGGMYGAGVYFAEKCSKSDQYCTPYGSANTYCLFLSRVLIGAPFHTKTSLPNTRRPPDMAAQAGRPHDSIIASLPKHYREVIVYSKTQAYPEFLVEYVRE